MQFNQIFVVSSLGPKSLQTGERLVRDDLEPRAGALGVGVTFERVGTLAEFRVVLERIATICREKANTFPILHLDAHGAEDGVALVPSGEIMSWSELAQQCRAINVACANNLLVTTGLCFGLLAITAVDIKQATPFFAVVGPEVTVSAGDVDAFGSFYVQLLEHGDADRAMEKLTGDFGLFLSERLFLNSIAGYFRSHCSGRQRRQRVERLITEAMKRESGTKLGLSKVRSIAKERTRPQREVFERFKRGFLLSGLPMNEGRFQSTFEQALEVADLGD